MVKEKLQRSIVYPEVKLKDVLWAFWQGIKSQKWWLFLLLFSVTSANIIAVIIPIFYKQFFDTLIINGDKSMIANNLFMIIIYIVILNGFFWFFYRIANLSNNTYQTAVMAKLNQQSYDYLMQHSFSFFSNSFTGSLVQRVNRFARAFERLSDHLTWDLLPLTVKVTSIFIVVLFINKWIALIILIWVAIFLTFNIVFSRWKLKYDIKVAEIDSKSTGYLADTITNQNTIALFDSFENESRGYKNVTDEQAKSTKFTWILGAIVEAGQGFLSFTMEFILFFFAIKYWQEGLITVGVFVLLQAYLINLIHELWGFTRTVRDIYQAYADAKEMVEIMLLPYEIKDSPTAKEIIVSKGGNVFIDGQDITKITQNSLRKNIAMVPQDPVLFHRTLAENIGYGKQNATKDEIEHASHLAHCDDFVYDLPFGFETYVGERGIKLSGGERQRVAIARAILKNAPILVLDEATSSLDSHSEGLIQDALDTLMLNKTTIVIAHRLSTIKKMDRIIVIDKGKSLYKKLWTFQAGGFLADANDDLDDEKKEENVSEEEVNDEDEGMQEAKLANF